MASTSRSIDIKVGIPARDELRLRAQLTEAGKLIEPRWSAIGCPELLGLLEKIRVDWQRRLTAQAPELGLDLTELALPSGDGHAEILFRELILKLQGSWQLPYADEELCHCRSVATQRVDQAIVCGSHNVQQVARATSAGTSCGTCRPDTERLIAYRLGR